MSKAVLLSIHPKWANLIYEGIKEFAEDACIERRCLKKAEEYK